MNALVIMIHGVGEHSGCYDALAEKFVTQSIGFLAFDLRGHGRSTGIRGHASVDAIKDDLRAVIKCVSKKFPDVPLVLFGHSMGGHIALSHVIDENVPVQGVIVSSPWLKLANPPSPWLVGMAGWASRIVPWITVCTGIRAEQLAPGGTATRSSRTDPLLHRKISVKLFSDLWANSETILRNKHRLNVPLLLMHGTADPLTSYQASKLFARNAGEYTTFKQWRGMYHDLLNDACNEVVFQYVMKWLSKQVLENGTVQNSRKMYCVA